MRDFLCKGAAGPKGKKQKAIVDPTSDLATFRELKKRGGDDFRQAILTYRTRCMGHGRGYTRPSFDWLRYYLCVVIASRQMTGSKFLYMSEHQFLEFMRQSEGMPRDQAELEFRKRCADPKSKTKEVHGRTFLLQQTEDFVQYVNEKSFEEHVEWGTKDKKAPDDADITALEECMGTDHRGFGDSDFWNLDGGKGPSAGASVGNKFAVSSARNDALADPANSPEQVLGAKRPGTELDEKLQKKPKKNFDIAGARTALAPQINAALSTVKSDATSAFTLAGDGRRCN